jgi:ankyrin repeat protein
MVEYILSTKNYKELLLTNTNISTKFIIKYLPEINHHGLNRYSLSENIEHTLKQSFLYKLFESEEIDVAAKNGHLEVVKYLYEKGLVERIKTKDNEHSINWAAMNGHLEVVKYLYKQGLEATENGINWAAKNCHLKVVKYLYNRGLKVTEYGIDLAANHGHLGVVKYLYSEEGSTVKLLKTMSCGKTSKDNVERPKTKAKYGLNYATQNNHLEVVKYLRSKGLYILRY